MATQQQIEALYDWVDYFQELRLGKTSDISCAFFDGDFTKTLDQAQADKHNWVLNGVNANRKGVCVLDIGSGWGPVLQAVQNVGGTGHGLTLSSAQVEYCAAQGLDAELKDWKTTTPQDLGMFDAVISIGAFEHFSSITEYESGEQPGIYERFFDLCADVLPDGGRLFLQTMISGKNMPEPSELSLAAPEGTPERILARLVRFYPGSWLPRSREQIVTSASKRFTLLQSSNGRRDYIETLNRWGESTRSLYRWPKVLPALAAGMRLVPRYLRSRDFRIQIDSLRRNDQQVAFVDEIITHERMFFQKK